MINCKKDFPIFARHRDLIFLDNANTTQKPYVVLEAMMQFYSSAYASPHRGDYTFAYEASVRYQSIRRVVQKFIGAGLPEEIIFTSGATQSMNTIVLGLRSKLREGDHIILSTWDHSSIFLPWQVLAEEIGLKIDVVDNWNKLPKYLSHRTKIINCNYYSHVSGERAPLESIISLAQKYNTRVIVDGTQAVASTPINVSSLGCDFFLFSGHKLYAPNGIGVLYVKNIHDDIIDPVYYGGGQISTGVSLTSRYPDRLEAGTPNLPALIGLEASIKYLSYLDMHKVKQHLDDLRIYLYHSLQRLGLEYYKGEGSLVSLKIPDPFSVACMLGSHNICVRAGHLCSQLFKDLPVVRISWGIYNDARDIDKFIKILTHIMDHAS